MSHASFIGGGGAAADLRGSDPEVLGGHWPDRLAGPARERRHVRLRLRLLGPTAVAVARVGRRAAAAAAAVAAAAVARAWARSGLRRERMVASTRAWLGGGLRASSYAAGRGRRRLGGGDHGHHGVGECGRLQ